VIHTSRPARLVIAILSSIGYTSRPQRATRSRPGPPIQRHLEGDPYEASSFGSTGGRLVDAAFTPTGPSLLNDLAFDDQGNLYVTDSFAATIYRIPAGGGAPAVWFTYPALAGNPMIPFGVNGIRIDRSNKKIYVSTVDAAFNGVIYRLPLEESPVAADLELFASLGFTGPDGIAFGKSGKL
jgi:DNA-binding beta-propeller fold protein YncE